MKKVFIIFFSLISVFTLFFVARTIAANGWTETRPAGNSDQSWTLSGMSDNGQAMIMAASGGRLYVSTNSGTLWTEKQPAGNASKNWRTACLSGDGTTAIAGVDNGRLYLSTNGGSSFSEVQPLGNVNSRWRTCAISDNGQDIWVGTDRHGGFLSTNGGSTWASDDPPVVGTDGVYFTASMSSDGHTIMVGTFDEGTLYLSTDTGGTWNVTNGSVTGTVWEASAMSANGHTIIAAQDSGRVYLTTNSGSSWTEVQPDGDQDHTWNWLAMSDDGATILAGDDTALLFSKNTGSSWSHTDPEGSNDSLDWGTVAINSDATNSLAAVDGTRVWLTGNLTASGGPTPTPTDTPTPTPVPSGGGSANNSSGSQDTSCHDSAPSRAPDLFQIDTTSTKAKVYFSPVTDNTDKYYISFGYTPGDMRFGGELAGNSTGVRSYTINSLSPNVKYYVRIRAGNGCATGNWSNEMKFMTAKKGSTSGNEYYESFASRIISSIAHLINF